MSKFLLLLLIMISSLDLKAQRLELLDVVSIYVAMGTHPNAVEQTATYELNQRAKGWTGPVIDRTDGYTATWTYKVGGVTNGIFRYVIQKVDDKPLFKVAYECPYESIDEDYKADLTANGAELVDSSNEADGSTVNVYKYKSYIFMIGKWAKSLGNTFAGVQTGYVKILMHHEIE